MLFNRNKQVSKINANHVTISVMLFSICIMLLPIFLYFFIGWIFSNITFSNYIGVCLSFLVAFITYFSLLFSLEDSRLTQISLQPYINITSKLDGNVLLICLENVGKGELYNLKLNQSTNCFLDNYGKLESEILEFDSINMYMNKKEQYKFIMKEDCSIHLNDLINLVFFFDDASGNPYKQTIYVIYNGSGFHFMPQVVGHRKKRDV